MKRLEAAIENIYETQCPGEWFPGEPVADLATFKSNLGGISAGVVPQGCRGISCKECWNAEMLSDEESDV